MPPIFPVCAASAAVTALLGTVPVRLFPFGEAPDGVARPYAVWQQIGGAPESLLAGGADMDGYSLQVDIYADSPGSADAVRVALRDAIEQHATITRWAGPPRDPTTGRYRAGFDVDWLVPR
jgi:hypothetical protein